MRAGATAFATKVLVIGSLNRALIEPIKALAPASLHSRLLQGTTVR